MAIYHLSLKAIQRSKGRSATASAAYRSRTKIKDERTGESFDYSRKRGIEARGIFTPDGTKIRREKLWNMAEQAERRKDGITAREYELALPAELEKKYRQELAIEFCQMLMERYGVAVDLSIHSPPADGDQRNHHAHVMITTRRYENGQLLEKTDFELSGRDRQKKGLLPQKEELESIREEWARMTNAALEKAQIKARISHKSLKEQDISRPATVHLGPAATAMERKGIQTERGDLNRWPTLRKLYSEFATLKKEIRIMEAQLAEMRRTEEKDDGRTQENNQNQRTNTGATPKTGATAQGKSESQSGKAGHPDGSFETARTRLEPEAGKQPGKIPNRERSRSGEKPARETGEPRKQPERGFRDAGENLRSDGRIISERPSRGHASGAGRSPEDFCDRRSDQRALGSGREAAESQRREKLAAIEARIMKLITEYGTIADLLFMKNGIGAKAKKEEKPSKRPDGPK